MMSPETSAPMEWRDDKAPTSHAARYTAAGLLALAAMLFLGGGTALHAVVSEATDHTTALGVDLDRVDDSLSALGDGVDEQVADAVDSARAATAAAEAALADVDDTLVDQARTALALSDAQVALDAASAQVRHVRERVDGTVGDALASLQQHLDALRQSPGEV
ncbi:hypothetical protein [Luteimicrobium subarcticum]|uniref:Uncharacterized protein n=1 Tax=Luteimicrobium subarcticum TaxID=620910 RepID=A0A2M8WJ75_9MICO|nr:hypothetical protein [Luteimicrobium subarcticum]PJI90985.1 hypothetical protein CLV34_2244 [Luteimicrobium subarcticum]